MAKPVKYKKPRAINAVTIALILVAGLLVYLALKFFPLFLVQQESVRVLDETASKFSGSKNRYLADPQQVEALEREMRKALTRAGITDPGFETWIEVDNRHSVRLGVAYIQTVTWPLDVIPPREDVIQKEYDLTLEW